MTRLISFSGVLLLLLHFVLTIIGEIIKEKGHYNHYLHREFKNLMAAAVALAVMAAKVSLLQKNVEV
jgi:hypothetical protein